MSRTRALSDSAIATPGTDPQATQAEYLDGLQDHHSTFLDLYSPDLGESTEIEDWRFHHRGQSVKKLMVTVNNSGKSFHSDPFLCSDGFQQAEKNLTRKAIDELCQVGNTQC
jgi:hypothetical protein